METTKRIEDMIANAMIVGQPIYGLRLGQQAFDEATRNERIIVGGSAPPTPTSGCVSLVLDTSLAPDEIAGD